MLKVGKEYVDLALSAVLVLTLLFHYGWGAQSRFDLALLVVVAVLGTLPVFINAVRAVFAREWASMDMLASIALAFSLFAGQWASAVFIALMLCAARILAEVTSARTEKSIKGLLDLRPKTAKVEVEGKITTVPLEQVRVGDVVVVDLGDRVPVDGTVFSGNASLDESSLTGESLPIEKKKDSKVFSSTLIASGSIRIIAEKVGKDTTLEKIIVLVESSRAEKPKAQTMGERFGKIYLIVVFIGSATLLAFTHNVSLVLAVVLVVCADDIAVAIPLAYLGAIGAAARRGVIIKGASHLEVLGSARTVVFDKTGTLTKGTLAVSQVVVAEGCTEKDLLRAGALADRRGAHPIARAFIAYAESHGCKEEESDSVEQIAGRGSIATAGKDRLVVGKAEFLTEQKITIPPDLAARADAAADAGQSVSFVAQNEVVLGFAAVADELKHNAKHAIAELRKLGVQKIVMLTGDNEHVAQAIAKELGISEVHANLLPEGKVALLKQFHTEGVVVMVGDGVNDAAALSAANVGIAMGAMGIDAAIDSAEIVLMRDDLLEIPEIMHLARAVRTISIQDFWIWGVTNAFGLALVSFGFIGPVGAAAYNFISDFFPLLNSARVRIIHKQARKARVRARGTI